MSIVWQQVLDGGGLSSPRVSLAGRGDEPVESAGDAAGAVVQRGSEWLNDHSISWRIESEQRRMDSQLAELFRNHAHGGVLVVACIEYQMVGAIESGLFRYMSQHPGVYSRPEHAIGHWRRHRMDAFGRSYGQSRLEYRFFWVTRR